MERLRPLAQKLRIECGLLDVPVIEALCISDGRFWSYCCGDENCCPAEGLPMGLPGTSVLAAAATYAGLQVRGTLRELRARLQPWETAAALEQESALDSASRAVIPRLLDDADRAGLAEETLELAERVMHRLADAAPVSGTLTADLRDDELITHDEAATLILGLQDRVTRDRAAEWMEGDEAACALRLWRALARRCVGSYGEHAAAPLTLAGWVAWSTGDDLEAREALAMALGADPDYLFAGLLHQACNEGLDPESIRRCLRAERQARGRAADPAQDGADAVTGVAATQAKAVAAGPAGADVVDPEGEPTAEDVGPEGEPEQRPQRVAPGAVPRTRRRTRQTGVPGRPARTAAGEGCASGARVPRPRTPVAGSPGPGSARTDRTRPRASGKGVVRRRGSLHPGGEGIEGVEGIGGEA
jgi:hypothetical protein